ncbi:hypothetical protein GGX14DRAFT_554130 [Mycena pura]|uniref:Uncharacterized protein n=1 Tax=Mycena pura TaxID=153505 RepID=A0AAD6YVN9_9AGAR|nr:hypothetical protein GGX14DRAFT_554130 [Mycena pura]
MATAEALDAVLHRIQDVFTTNDAGRMAILSALDSIDLDFTMLAHVLHDLHAPTTVVGHFYMIHAEGMIQDNTDRLEEQLQPQPRIANATHPPPSTSTAAAHTLPHSTSTVSTPVSGAPPGSDAPSGAPPSLLLTMSTPTSGPSSDMADFYDFWEWPCPTPMTILGSASPQSAGHVTPVSTPFNYQWSAPSPFTLNSPQVDNYQWSVPSPFTLNSPQADCGSGETERGSEVREADTARESDKAREGDEACEGDEADK